MTTTPKQTNLNFLCSTMDAKIWADEFCKLNTAADHGTMLGWFANAIMAGYDEATRRAAPTAQVQEHLTTPNTYGGFQASFYVEHKRNPTQQEVFDAGVRSGRKLGSVQGVIPSGHVPADKVAIIGNRPSELMGTWIVNDLVPAVKGVPKLSNQLISGIAQNFADVLTDNRRRVRYDFDDAGLCAFACAVLKAAAPQLGEQG